VRGGGGWISWGVIRGSGRGLDVLRCAGFVMVAGTSIFRRLCSGDVCEVGRAGDRMMLFPDGVRGT